MDSIHVRRVPHLPQQEKPPTTLLFPPIDPRACQEQQHEQQSNVTYYNPTYNAQPYDSLVNTVYAARPIPSNVIPVAALGDEVKEHERFFEKHPTVTDSMTIAEILEPFNNFKSYFEFDRRSGKILFLDRFIAKISRQQVNFDLAIVCNSKESENYLSSILTRHLLNIEKNFVHFEERANGVYGILVKIRAGERRPFQFKPIKRDNVDLVMVFDSACSGSKDEMEKYDALFPGYHLDQPPLVYLVTMDSAEIRLHTYNRAMEKEDESRLIKWDTRVGQLDPQLKNALLLQPNHTQGYGFCAQWIDYVRQAFFNWAYKKEDDEYEFIFPRESSDLLTWMRQFPTHHPIVTTKQQQRPQEEPSGNKNDTGYTSPPMSAIKEALQSRYIAAIERELEAPSSSSSPTKGYCRRYDFGSVAVTLQRANAMSSVLNRPTYDHDSPSTVDQSQTSEEDTLVDTWDLEAFEYEYETVLKRSRDDDEQVETTRANKIQKLTQLQEVVTLLESSEMARQRQDANQVAVHRELRNGVIHRELTNPNHQEELNGLNHHQGGPNGVSHHQEPNGLNHHQESSSNMIIDQEDSSEMDIDQEDPNVVVIPDDESTTEATTPEEVSSNGIVHQEADGITARALDLPPASNEEERPTSTIRYYGTDNFFAPYWAQIEAMLIQFEKDVMAILEK